MPEPERKWESWSPAWAPEIVGEYEEPRFEGGMSIGQKWRARCTVEGCGAKFEGTCSTGVVRAHIAKFASVHVPEHRSPLQASRVEHPGSMRRKANGAP